MRQIKIEDVVYKVEDEREIPEWRATALQLEGGRYFIVPTQWWVYQSEYAAMLIFPDGIRVQQR